MTLLRAANMRLTFGSRTIFDDLTLTIEEGERVGLVGVNGSGKSSLMKILAGRMTADSGEIQLQRGARVTHLQQDAEFPEGATIQSELDVASEDLRKALAEHAALADFLSTVHEGPEAESKLKRMSVLTDVIDKLGGWDTAHQSRTLLDKLGVHDWDRPMKELSGGNQKRVSIAKALLTRPDLLLLDEPTNHLDADTVEWLEEELDEFTGGLLLVTHDRYFLNDLVDRIIEIQPGKGAISFPGNYEMYLEQKFVLQEEAVTQSHKRERWISQEVAWMRRGPQARRTKSKDRMERAAKLLTEKGFQRPKIAALQGVAAPRLGNTILEAEHVSKSFGDNVLMKDVTFRMLKGQRVGLVGPNGVGKTTFLRVMLGELPPDSGVLTIGKNTKVAYFDQGRTKLNPDDTVYDACWGEDYVELGGKRVALRDYLEDLLFPVPMQKQPVSALSGGERHRLLLARLFLLGANVLVLDEPTNDLDLVTLNILEQRLAEFEGSVLLVSHDRYFLDKVATTILSFEGDGKVVEYPGNFDMYRRLKAKQTATTGNVPAPSKNTPPKSSAPQPVAKAPEPVKKGKLSFKEQRELDTMEKTIELAEQKRAALERSLGDGGLWASDPKKAHALQGELEAAKSAVDALYLRWQVLQDK
jgi:ATP-binding cassette subfamily F protein uup